MLSLVWFRRDLRVHDHPALSRAAAEGPVLPVYIVDPVLLAPDETSERHIAFLGESLRALNEDLASLGQPLVLRVGDSLDVLARLVAKHRVTRIVTHPETGSLAARALVARAGDWARGRGLDWLIVPESGAEPCAAPALAPVTEGTGVLPGARALGFAASPCAFRQPGGRDAGLQMLETYLSVRGQGLPPTRATAPEAERSGARLSPYLSFGVLSSGEIRASIARFRDAPDTTPERLAAARLLTAQLKRRDTARAAPLAEPEGAPARGSWASGETGLPFVDAAMRALIASGWLDHRSRALLAATGMQLHGLGAAAVGRHLAQMSTDHDPAILWREMARAGQGPILDPVATGRKLDPTGAFIRRWLPELRRVPDSHLHTPWFWPDARRALAGRYPEPVLDPACAAREARALRARMAPGRGRTGSRVLACDDPLIEGGFRAARGPQMMLDL
ncbi:deoxyribodipyrimidine photo-lyase [Rhodobacter sp. NTK016B]|uniref:FAD-binding domain-containing protein n=1 Tax=Rhodobacter sp. NTK016B TaxID=2759676 RepID=UPI001A8D01D0|nr:FAD-binding domain-containing protein [Rhodobacter sp. NTK016B]MBN8292659.1 deoxyribodipyrimidine photo-lyase [Rhodobacter sp. NTK016B]